MSPNDTATFSSDSKLTGTAREFAEFCKGERQRRANTEHAFDPTLFDDAVAYILHQLTPQAKESQA